MTTEHPKLKEIAGLIAPLGVELDVEQLHIQGERFLMQKDKLVLTGIKDGKKVIVKASDMPLGKKEIEKEKHVRDVLTSISFASDKILIPKEIDFLHKGSFTVWITEFISQEKVFVEHSLEEQFFMALRAFEAQEAFHATTFEHMRDLEKVFEVFDFSKYQRAFASFDIGDEELKREAEGLLGNKVILAKFSGYLTHTDFVPHNFRIRNRQIYMLDLSAVHFGNKYEGWARFLNYMVIHNPKLESLLLEYIQKNRSPDDFLALQLMRAYKIGFLLDFYAKSLPKTEGDLKALTLERIGFWQEILRYVLEDKRVPEGFVEEYKKKRDELRSDEEKRRQREFAVA